MMPVIALAGKGGAGKTTVAGLLARYLVRRRLGTVVQSSSIGTGTTRHDFLNTEIRLAVEEGNHVDLLAMGRPEGEYDAVGRPLVDLGADSPAAQAIEALAERLIHGSKLTRAASPGLAVSNQSRQ